MAFFLIQIPLRLNVVSFLVSVEITVITTREFPTPCPVYDASVVVIHSLNIQDYEIKGGVMKPYVRKYKDPSYKLIIIK
jgi:hypothetical protein